jgi:imidazoleglycerol-phosphate dehydratase
MSTDGGLGISVSKLDLNEVQLVRRTAETEVKCRVYSGKKEKWNIDTGLHFFNHMIEELAYFSEFNIDVSVKSPHYLLAHTTVEDTGITLGRAFYELATTRAKGNGIRGFGFSQGLLDEAFVEVRTSFEGRVGIHMDRRARRFGMVEDVQEEFMESFFQGFAQGMKLTIHLDLLRGEDPHHLWESAFRAFGDALRQLLKADEWKKGGVSGVKGTVE